MVSKVLSTPFVRSFRGAPGTAQAFGIKTESRWIPDVDSNHDSQIQSLLSYR